MEEITSDLLRAGAVVLVAILVRAIVGLLIRRLTAFLLNRPPDSSRLGRAASLLGTSQELLRHEQRVRTLSSLLRNVLDIVLLVLTVMTVLAIFGIPMAPLLASAGIGGIAIGFGAQTLVKDYLSGMFMLVEDQFGVGDVVQIDDVRGTVEEVTLRVTKVRDAAGVLWYIRNGEVLTLGNISQGTSAVIVDVPAAPDEDPERVTRVLTEALAGVAEQFPEIHEGPNVLGVGAVDASQMTFQVWIRTGPNQQWGPMRTIRQLAQEAFAREGIRGPVLPPRA